MKKIAILLFIASSFVFAQNTSAGYHSVTWDATNDLGQQVGAGVYLYQLQTNDFVNTRKMVLLK